MKTKKDYQTEAEKLAKAIDIAIESYTSVPPEEWDTVVLKMMTKTHREWKENALNPDPPFRNLKSLQFLVDSVFTFFNEGNGPTVELFWKKLKEVELDYPREDRLGKVLKRDKIKSRSEYNLVTDMMVGAHQTGRISEKEFKRLSEMIDEFERSNGNNPNP